MQPEVFAQTAAVQQDHWWFSARRHVLAAVIGTLALPPRAEILEIGCGTGANLKMLLGFGRLRAVEYDDAARAKASSLGICGVDAGGLPEPLPFQDGEFDLVCLLDVLEHVEDDGAALTRAARLLKPSGHLLVTVPAYAWLWSGHDDAHHHYRRYTAAMLRQRASEAGLRICRLGYFNSILFPLIAGIRAMRKLLGRNGGSDAALPPPWLNGVLEHVFGFERHIVPTRLFPFGTSVLAVLRTS